MKLHGNMKVKNNELEIGGVKVTTLAKKFGTPLYIYDREEFKRIAGIFKTEFKSKLFNTHISFASKAFSNLYIAGLAKSQGLFLDVVSGGELYTAIKAGYDPEKISLHGNNKLAEELEMALTYGVGRIIIDHEGDYELLTAVFQKIFNSENKIKHLKLSENAVAKTKLLLRINPSISAHTHNYIQTGNEDSKFGMNLNDSATMCLLRRMSEDRHFELEGLHCHIGSQIGDPEFFYREAESMIIFMKKIVDTEGIPLDELNLGGGFGVYYTSEKDEMKLSSFLPSYISKLENLIRKTKLSIKTISIEPGRSLINSCGSMLYRVGAVKKPLSGLPYIFVDGGMSDNPRPALYGAEYEACLPLKMDFPNSSHYKIAGKCCESGDILIQDALLPSAEKGDLLLIPATGAYTYSMSSNYNRIPKPAVVFVEGGKIFEAVKRESYDDIVRNDLPYA